MQRKYQQVWYSYQKIDSIFKKTLESSSEFGEKNCYQNTELSKIELIHKPLLVNLLAEVFYFPLQFLL